MNKKLRPGDIEVSPIVAWYDLWVGVFIDVPKKRVYLFPVPCLGIVIQWKGD